MIIDGYGASETGGMAFGASTKGAQTQQFQPSAGAAVLSADRTRFLEPGDDEIGWIARIGRVPLGYLERSGAHRADVSRSSTGAGSRCRAIAATLAADGTIVLLGRDSMVVNSGGEKIFVEEVEDAIRRHPDVLDALVVGRPSDRFGEEVVALVQLRDGADLTGADIREYAAETVARFKAPRAVLAVRSHRTSPVGQGRLRLGAASRARRRRGHGLTSAQLARHAEDALGDQVALDLRRPGSDRVLERPEVVARRVAAPLPGDAGERRRVRSCAA